MYLFVGLFITPSWQTLTVLAYGRTLAGGKRQKITTYLCLMGATSVKRFSCFYRFLGGALYQLQWQEWARIIRCATRRVPEGVPIVLIVIGSTKKKAGRQIKGVGHYRNRAGSARQEHRTLRGLTFVSVLVPGWPGQRVSMSIGLSLYLKAKQARTLHVPYQSRSALAREIAAFVSTQLPTRRIWVLRDDGYAITDTLQQLPAMVDVVSCMLITNRLYASPPRGTNSRWGCPPKKGPHLGLQKPRLANGRAGALIPGKPGHSSRGVDGTVAYHAAGATALCDRGALSAASLGLQGGLAHAVTRGGGIFHDQSRGES